MVKFVSFTGAFTSKYVVKSVKEACETVHSTPKETCQHATQFDRPSKSACFWWVKETPKDAQECHLGLCKFVGYFHAFPSSYSRRRKGPAVPKRDQQKMQRKSLYIFQTHEDERGPSDHFSAPFAVVKRYHIAGNKWLTPVSKFGTMMTGIFLRK